MREASVPDVKPGTHDAYPGKGGRRGWVNELFLG